MNKLFKEIKIKFDLPFSLFCNWEQSVGTGNSREWSTVTPAPTSAWSIGLILPATQGTPI